MAEGDSGAAEEKPAMIKRNSVFKATVALKALRGEATVAELAARHKIDPGLIEDWKRRFAEGARRWPRKSGQDVWL
jgi:transposase-like protein